MEAGFDVRQWDPEAISFSESELQSLANGDGVTLHDNIHGQNIYLLKNQQLLEVHIENATNQEPGFLLYSGLFFVLLAAAMAIWVWPLWRDLETVKQATEKLNPNGTMPPIALSKRSLISGIAKALNTMNLRVQHLHQLQQELIGAVAHEIRTPLARLKFAMAMQEDAANNGMKDDVQEMEKLVQEMLDYTAMEAQLPDMTMSEIPLNALCEHVISQLDPEFTHDKRLSVIGEELTLVADSHYLERAIHNLASNACRYAKAQVQIHLLAHQSQILISLKTTVRE